ncbi:CAF17-like 4Fe-4S cluster assembly/insertion protein YgfZ [Entomomonas asaccharolytica]|uniref:Folate-binding protein YgfZ n=1 Tax=Entomomonas asaccharolytica TaxID=2785331 RepID=A0A974NDQ0_9GAMM|nr:folate-binding protein YgfZ [Entomomonas asaccharolytica]QQP84896.1 folate-binding protein YgfZ [Entomomonas asaccharolytica]
MTTPFFCLLNHESIIAIQGIDSKKFLQGQITCNLNYLSTEQSSLGASCTPKGRMVSSFRLIEQSTNNYLLSLDKNLFEKQLADFKKYAVFSKVTLEKADQQWLRFGLQATPEQLSFLELAIPQQANQVVQHPSQQYFLINISEQRYELWVTPAQRATIKPLLTQQLTEKPLNDWLLGQIRAGIGQVFIENSEEFVPQMINLQSVGGVSFKKGCYLGQEIVARMQYLGKLKRHLYRFALDQQDLPSIGTDLFSTVHQTSVGRVVLAAHTEDQKIELLAVTQDEAITNELWLQDNQTNLLKLLSIPYQVNPEEEIKH